MNAPREALVIERLAARFRGAAPLPAERCQRWLNALAEADGEALTAGLAAPDEWLLIRRLPLALRWREDSNEADVLGAWQRALRRALEAALAHPAGNEVLRYPNRRAALADLLYRSALGETARQWAWQRMGLIPRAGLPPAEALGHGLRALLASPELIWPVLSALIAGEPATAALTALLRALPGDEWLALLRACPRTAGYLMACPATEPAAAALSGLEQAVLLPNEAGEAARELLRWAAARPHFAAPHCELLSVLIAALAWPAASASAALLSMRLAAVRAWLAQLLPPAPEETRHEPRDAAAVRREAAAAPLRDADLPPLPVLPQATEWLDTAWGGALFWLARIPAGPLLDWLAAQDQISLPSMLRALGEALGVPAEDPALRALCGGDLPAALPPGEPAEAVREQAALQAALWAAWLDEAAPELPEPRMLTICQRPGRLRFEPGWIELHLPLSSADASLRRLGLDLDPGWLPWLGCVVRFVYDD